MDLPHSNALIVAESKGDDELTGRSTAPQEARNAETEKFHLLTMSIQPPPRQRLLDARQAPEQAATEEAPNAGLRSFRP